MSSSVNNSLECTELLETANSASQSVAALHVAFMAFMAYFGVITWGTDHEAMLLESLIKLPILDVELPLKAFFCFVPWLLVLLHFNLLLQNELLSRKLWNLDLVLLNNNHEQQIRDSVFIFPFSHFIAGRDRTVVYLIVFLTDIFSPLALLLYAQIHLLPYHDEIMTLSQRFAIWVDLLLLFFLWPLIVSINGSRWESWRRFIILTCTWATK
jgi:hypothetical protein